MPGIKRPISELGDILTNKNNQCDVCQDDIFYEDEEWNMIVSSYDQIEETTVFCTIPINYCYSCGKNYKGKESK